MDNEVTLRHRALCLELATKVALATMNAYSVATLSEEYWQWLNKLSEVVPATKNPSDDIPF